MDIVAKLREITERVLSGDITELAMVYTAANGKEAGRYMSACSDGPSTAGQLLALACERLGFVKGE